MVSLTEEIKRSSLRDGYLKTALQTYAGTIENVEESLLHEISSKTGEAMVSLERERRILLSCPEPSELQRVGDDVERVVRASGLALRTRLAGSVELSEVLQLITEAAQKVGARGAAQESSVSGVTSRIRSALDENLVAEFRRRVESEVAALERLVVQMKEENRSLLEGLELEMANYRKKLDEATSYSTSDPLTGLPNREALQETIRELQLTSAPLSLVVIEIGSLLRLQEQHGRAATDALLIAVAERLKAVMRPGEFAARFHAAAFAVAVPSGKRDAMIRSHLFEQALRCEYRLRPDLRCAITFSLGITEPLHEESVEDTLTRAASLVRFE